MSGSRSCWMLEPPEYSSAMAVKIDSVPSVTMNGGG